jgi:putative oxidoreductase
MFFIIILTYFILYAKLKIRPIRRFFVKIQNKTFTDFINLHKEELVDIIRIYLGIVFVIKGVQFFMDVNILTRLIESLNFPLGLYTILALSHIIIFVHIIGGIFLALGLLTKLTALLQIPIVLSAIIFIHLKEGFMSDSLHFALFVLLLSIVFALHGSSKLSIDYYLEHYKEHDIKFLHR